MVLAGRDGGAPGQPREGGGLFLRDGAGVVCRREGPRAAAGQIPDDGTVFSYCTVSLRGGRRAYTYLTGDLPLKAGDWFGRSAPSFTAPAPRPLAAGADENRPAAGGGPGELPLRGGSGRSVALPPGAVQ